MLSAHVTPTDGTRSAGINPGSFMFTCDGRSCAAFSDSSCIETQPQLNLHWRRPHTAAARWWCINCGNHFHPLLIFAQVLGAEGWVEERGQHHPISSRPLRPPVRCSPFASLFFKYALNYSVRQVAVCCIIFFATGRRVSRRWDRCPAAEFVRGWMV